MKDVAIVRHGPSERPSARSARASYCVSIR